MKFSLRLFCLLAFITSFLAVSQTGVAASSQTAASGSSPSAESPGSLPVLLSLDHVRKDLHLTSLQSTVINSLRSDYRAAAQKLSEAGHASAAAARKAQADLAQVASSYNKRALNALNPHQRLRLRQIERQILGGYLLTAPSEQKRLGLNDQQKSAIAAIASDSKKNGGIITSHFEQGKLSFHQKVTALHKNRTTHAAAMLKVLTPSQLQAWNGSLGAKLVF